MMIGIRGSHGLGCSYGALRTCKEWSLQGRDGMVLEGGNLGSFRESESKTCKSTAFSGPDRDKPSPGSWHPVAEVDDAHHKP